MSHSGSSRGRRDGSDGDDGSGRGGDEGIVRSGSTISEFNAIASAYDVPNGGGSGSGREDRHSASQSGGDGGSGGSGSVSHHSNSNNNSVRSASERRPGSASSRGSRGSGRSGAARGSSSARPPRHSNPAQRYVKDESSDSGGRKPKPIPPVDSIPLNTMHSSGSDSGDEEAGRGMTHYRSTASIATVRSGARTARDVFEEMEDAIELNLKLGEVSMYSQEDLLIIRQWTTDTVKYFCFILLFTWTVFGNRPGEVAYYYTENLRDLLLWEEFPLPQIYKNFLDVATIEEFQEWLEGPFLAAMYPEEYYNGEDLPPRKLRNVNTYGTIVGLVRLRQKRVVKNEGCSVPEIMQEHAGASCAPEYESEYEDKSPFGTVNNTKKYKYERPLKNHKSWSHLAKLTSYNPGGHVIDLPKDRDEAVAVIQETKQDRWLGEQTRAVFVEFTLYNRNLNLFCVCRIVIETPTSGGAIPSYVFRTLRFLPYQTPFSKFIFALEMLLILFILWFIFEEGWSLYNAVKYHERGWKAYFLDDMWHYLDLLNLFLFVIIIILRITVWVQAQKILTSKEFEKNDEYIEFQDLAFVQQNMQYLNAFNMLFCWIKTFKHLGDLPRIGQLVKTLITAALDTLLFVVMFFFVFVGYAQCGYMMFSLDLYDFRTIASTMQSMLRFIVGDFDYSGIQLSNRLLGPVFFFTYMLLVFFVLLNMFIAIINNAYEYVRTAEAKMSEQKRKEAEIRAFLFPETKARSTWDHTRGFLQMMYAAMTVRKEQTLIELVESGQMDEDGDGLISRAELQKRLPATMDIETLMKQYDVDGSGSLDTHEVKRWLNDLKAEKDELETVLSLIIEAKEGGMPVDRAEEEELKTRVLEYLKKVKNHIPGDSDLMHLHYHAPQQQLNLNSTATSALEASNTRLNMKNDIGSKGPFGTGGGGDGSGRKTSGSVGVGRSRTGSIAGLSGYGSAAAFAAGNTDPFAAIFNRMHIMETKFNSSLARIERMLEAQAAADRGSAQGRGSTVGRTSTPGGNSFHGRSRESMPSP